MQDDAEGGEDEDDDEEDMLAAALSEIIEQDGAFSLDDLSHAAANVENFESDDDDLMDKEMDRYEHEAAESVVDEHMKTVIKKQQRLAASFPWMRKWCIIFWMTRRANSHQKKLLWKSP